jgi:hypothetical protein
VEISVLNCQATPNPQPSESSDLRVIELGDKTGRPQICARSTCQATRMRLFQTDCERLRFMSLACKRPWTSQRFVLRSRQAFSECHLLNCLVFGGAASEHVLMPLSQATTQLKPTDRSPETSFTTLVDISNNPVAACTFATLQHLHPSLYSGATQPLWAPTRLSHLKSVVSSRPYRPSHRQGWATSP